MNDIDPGFGKNVLNNMIEQFVKPEVVKRQKKGLISVPFPIKEAQVIFSPKGRMEIRLNEEVKYKLIGADAKLIEEESENGHMTLYLVNGKHNITFDFRYYRDKSRETLGIAKQFIETAEFSYHKKNFNALIDNLFSAYELISSSFLIQSRIETKTHKTLSSKINQHMKAYVNFDKRFIQNFNILTNLRPKARYLKNGQEKENDFQEMIDVGRYAIKIISQSL